MADEQHQEQTSALLEVMSDEVIWVCNPLVNPADEKSVRVYIGKFKGLRLTGRRVMQVMKRRVEIIRSSEHFDYQGSMLELDAGIVLAAEIIATHEIIGTEALELGPGIVWNNTKHIDNDDLLMMLIYQSYMEHRNPLNDKFRQALVETKNS